MLPQDGQVTSSKQVAGDFVGTRAFQMLDPFYAIADGPAGVNDISLGLRHQVWEAKILSSSIYLSAPTVAPFVVYTALGLNFVQLAFDISAHPVVIFEQLGNVYLRWFNPATQVYEIKDFGTNIFDPQIAIDDPRPSQANLSDVIFSYIKNGDLYYRQIRDLFNTEYRLTTSGDIIRHPRSGMTNNMRFQFEVESEGQRKNEYAN